MFMPWSEELFTGITIVDEQHKWLVDATNQLHAEIGKAECDPKVVGEIMTGLLGYTFKHFIMEEEMFERFGFPDTVAHKEQHNIFTGDIAELLQKHEKGEIVSTEALELLRNWLIHHIMKTDKAYVPFLKSKGVA